MGAWGPGNFENDAALDWLADLNETGSAEIIRAALERVARASEGAYLRTNVCCAALAAAEVVAAARGAPAKELPERVTEWVEAHPSDCTSMDAVVAREATSRIEAASELQELFDEGGRDEKWHRVLSELLHRLSGG
jgi:hypothetical protein